MIGLLLSQMHRGGRQKREECSELCADDWLLTSVLSHAVAAVFSQHCVSPAIDLFADLLVSTATRVSTVVVGHVVVVVGLLSSHPPTTTGTNVQIQHHLVGCDPALFQCAAGCFDVESCEFGVWF